MLAPERWLHVSWVSIFRIAMQIGCSTQSSVRRWGPISYRYLEPHAEGLSLRLSFYIDIHWADANNDLPTRQRKASALQKTR